MFAQNLGYSIVESRSCKLFSYRKEVKLPAEGKKPMFPKNFCTEKDPTAFRY